MTMTGLGVAPGARIQPNTDLGPRLDELAAAGATSIRRYLNWAVVERDLGSGVYDWSREDRVVGAVADRGMTILLGLSGRGDRHDLDVEKLVPAADFARAAAARYGTDPTVVGFEGPNELMLGTKYDPNPTPARYAAYQRAIFAGARDGCPTALVGSGSFIGDADFLAALYALPDLPDGTPAWRGHFGFLADHPYTCHTTPPMSPTESVVAHRGGWWAMLERRRAMAEHGDRHVPTWITEYGSNTAGTGARTEARQAEDLTDAVTRFRNHAWAGRFYWFTSRDVPAPGADQGDSMGLYRSDGTPKAIVETFRSLGA